MNNCDCSVNQRSGKQKPWLNADGSPKSTAELEEVCRSWSPLEWETYLASTETPQNEVLLDDPTAIEQFAESSFASTASMADQLSLPSMKRLLKSQLRRLPSREREIIHMRYFQGLETSEIASRLGISPVTVRTAMGRGLEKLRDHVVRTVTIRRELAARTNGGAFKGNRRETAKEETSLAK